MRIHRDGLGTIAGIWLVCLGIMFLISWLVKPIWIVVPICVILTFLMCFILYFFRVPVRRGNIDSPKAVTSVADGEVVIIEKVFEEEYLKKECIQISVYMNFFNMHVNFWPVTGTCTYYKYHPGKYFLAFMPKASELNEHTSIAMKTEDGQEIFFKQIAGTFARRIVCKAKEGVSGERGRQCGLIKFGSRIDLFVPLDADIKVEVGDDVVACLSVLAELK
ncbi:MAG: phosphatidylserine decarboxylase family protein [Bacteroidales bacterium]|nr:phosphatidylserine decarboxylase family protein [Bacteroidales bacterium]